MADLISTILLLSAIEKIGLDILLKNNESVKTQIVSVPIILIIIQGCIFAPIIKEMTFHFSIIGNPKTRLR